MPATLDPGKVHLPSGLQPNGWGWRPEQRQALSEWMAVLHALHNAVVPEDLRVETPFSSSLEFWMGFLSACAVYNPPPEDLLGFADHGVAAYGDFVNPLNPWAEDDESPEMLAPPIRFLPDPGLLYEAFRRRHDRIIDGLHERLQAKRVDVRELADHLEARYLEDEARTREERERDPWASVVDRPYITVDEHTTEEDVRNAYRLMVAMLPVRPRLARPKRDPLISLQCALWYDECGWSQERIAERMGWVIQRPSYAKPRSETARQHIAEGRKLLSHKKVAA